MQPRPLMPKATAVWLVENTALTFEQIAKFCNMDPLEIEAIADGEVASNIIGQNPVILGQLTWEEIKRCEKDQKAELELAPKISKKMSIKKTKQTKYTPVARRQDKPDAIYWIIKQCPEMADAQIVKLIGTTKTTIEAIRHKRHWNSANIRPRDPVLLGLCKQADLDAAIAKARTQGDKPFNLGGEVNV